MNSLIDELHRLASDPIAWGAVPILAAFAIYAIWHRYSCPLLHRTAHITLEQAEKVVGKPHFAGPRYLILMLAGIAATVAALTLISEGIYPTLAFYLLVAGVFVIQTEPARLQLREAEMRVVAAEVMGPEARQSAIARLETSIVWLATLQATIFAGTVLFLLTL